MPYSDTLDVRVTDSSLRDGSHAKRHQFTEEQVVAIVGALDDAGVPVIEVSHGDGLGGSSFNYGFSKTPEQDLIRAAVKTAKSAKIAFLMLPGLGTKDDIRAALDSGASVCRVATHCTEADVSRQHFGLARELGLETVGFLMMAHSSPPEDLAKQARIMADAGCQCVYVVDSAGALQIDGSTRRFGAGAGNTPIEAFAAAAEKIGIRTGIDVLKIIDAAEDVVRPAMDGECELDRLAILMGYAGVYSSFLKHAYRQAERYDVSGAELLLRAGRRKLVGGQEDQLIDIALELAAEK
jgi:4-hydroxy 2-oxovalerate aldolase